MIPASQPIINQEELKDLILYKDVTVPNDQTGLDEVRSVPYNEDLHRYARMLGAYKFDQLELQILKDEIWAALPEWRKKQIEKPVDAK